jgi:hypothetical protein
MTLAPAKASDEPLINIERVAGAALNERGSFLEVSSSLGNGSRALHEVVVVSLRCWVNDG